MFHHIENKYIFHPERAVPEDLNKFGHTEAVIQGNNFNVSVRYKIKESPYLILLSHGNSSSIDSIGFIYEFYERLGVSYFAYDYPGYGRSTGKPTEKGCYESFKLAYDYVVNELKIPTEKIVLHGISLGGAVTIEGAQHVEAKKIVLLATFTSTADLTGHLAKGVPFAKLIARQFKSIKKIGKLKAEILFIHGDNDLTIPASHSVELQKACNSPNYLYIVKNCDHKNHIQAGGEEFFQVWMTFLERGVVGFTRR